MQKIRLSKPAIYDAIDDSIVFLFSYPRSGNNWIVNLLTDMLEKGTRKPDRSHPIHNGKRIVDGHMIKNQSELCALNDFSGIVKSHYIDFQLKKRAIYIYRDPRDVIPSYLRFHKFQGYTGFDPPYSWRVINFFLTELINHWKVALQIKRARPDHILFVSYESLHIEPIKALNSLARFLDLSNISDTELHLISVNNNFQNMQQKYSRWTIESNGEIFLKYGFTGAGSKQLSKMQSLYISLFSASLYAKMNQAQVSKNL